MEKPFYILSIDGGGYRGIYAAHLLKRIKEEFRVDWLNDFGLITGTSTGSIIASGLVSEIPIENIIKLYEDLGSIIFKKSCWPRCGFFSSKFESDLLGAELAKFFKEKKLGDIKFPLIIPSTDIGNGRVHVFKTAYDSRFLRDKEVLMKDAILASCSAPTYFNPHPVKPYLLADGGMWANNPSLVATIDAKKRLGICLDDVRVLSIGCGKGNSFYPYPTKIVPWIDKIWGWGFLSKWKRNKFIDMLLNLQSESATNMLGLLLNPGQVLRINFDSDQKLALDDPEDKDRLIAKADFDFTHLSADIKVFLNK
ncbi:MAG TPA: CBASS cGAMP-activated phospholipase [Bacteriovoracaceae bacterium]|nr:CBASS cGAMP-activated phospholipase [Bacteriovoracaceae bacterium]